VNSHAVISISELSIIYDDESNHSRSLYQDLPVPTCSTYDILTLFGESYLPEFMTVLPGDSRGTCSVSAAKPTINGNGYAHFMCKNDVNTRYKLATYPL
jgi:hypothetical protein